MPDPKHARLPALQGAADDGKRALTLYVAVNGVSQSKDEKSCRGGGVGGGRAAGRLGGGLVIQSPLHGGKTIDIVNGLLGV